MVMLSLQGMPWPTRHSPWHTYDAMYLHTVENIVDILVQYQVGKLVINWGKNISNSASSIQLNGWNTID